MSHELTTSDGMFTVRTAAWHGLGTVFQDYPKREVAQPLVHDWEPVTEPVYRKRVVPGQHDESCMPGCLQEHFDYILEEVLESKLVARSDNGDALKVMDESYELVTNSEMWDIGEAIETSGSDVMFETGGSFRGGRQVWLLLRLQEPIVIKGDPRGETIPYYALQNSHDGSGAFRGQATMTRIVCANTSKTADWDAKNRGTEFTFRHTKNVGDRIEQARTALSGWRESLSAWQDQAEHLLSIKLDPLGSAQYLDRFLPMPPEAIITERVRDNIVRDRQKWLDAYNSVTGEGLKNTAYGLVQASIEFLEWGRRAYSAESRFRRSFLTRDGLVERAIKMAMEAPLA